MDKEQARRDAWERYCPSKDNPRPPTVTEHLAFIQGFDAGIKHVEMEHQSLKKESSQIYE